MKKILFLAALLPLSACLGAQADATSLLELPEAKPFINDFPNPEILQSLPPEPGDTLVILHTNLGDITLRMFPEETPIAYENFVTHARNGYYDGVIFHRIIEDFMIQTGDPQGTGMGGESIYGQGFGPEFSPELRHFRGAVGMAQSRLPNSIGSQFYIVQNSALDADTTQFFEALKEQQNEIAGENENGEPILVSDVFPESHLQAYLDFGGTPHLDLLLSDAGHTVFAQVIDGMNVVDAIAAVQTNAQDRPLNDIIIISTSVITVSDFED